MKKCKITSIIKRFKKIPPKTMAVIAIALTGGAVAPETITALINIFNAS